MLGPAISDNALTCVPVTDELELPSINWTGSEQARSEWMFHYQVGSLEDEPFVIARRIAERGTTGLRSCARTRSSAASTRRSSRTRCS